MPESRGPDRRFFDVWSLSYDAPLMQRLTYRPGQDAVLRRLKRLEPGSVLDVGCGTGRLAVRIGRELPRSRVVGCDFSDGMLRRARSRSRSGFFVRADAQKLPFRDASFDALVSTEAFHWFPSQPAALSEFFRVLRPGGHALIALINPLLESTSRVTRLGSRLAGQPLFWPTRRRMRRLVEAAGFRVESQRSVTRLSMRLGFPEVLTVAAVPDEVAEQVPQPR